MVSVCKLCHQPKVLQSSHVFPQFVIRWMKKTGTDYLRSIETPNLRKQDGPTERWLCSDCEQRLSTRENYFASEIFYPLVETSSFSFAYDGRLLHFLVSVLWRIVHRNLGDAVRENDPFLGDIRAAEEEWRLFLLETQPLLRFAHVHLFLSDLSVESLPGVPHFNTYCTRALDGVVMTDTRPRFVYAKLARFKTADEAWLIERTVFATPLHPLLPFVNTDWGPRLIYRAMAEVGHLARVVAGSAASEREQPNSKQSRRSRLSIPTT